MAHLLSCRLLNEAYMADDLATVTERAKAGKWEKIVWRTRKKKIAILRMGQFALSFDIVLLNSDKQVHDSVSICLCC